MTKLFKTTSLILALILVLISSVSCMADLNEVEDETEPKTDAELIIGTWESEIDFSPYLNAEFAKEEEMGYYVQVEDIKMTLIMTFDDHGNFTASYDGESIEQAQANLKEGLTAGIEKYFMDVAKDLGVSYNYFLTYYLGMSVEAYVNMIYASGDPMDIEETVSRGSYRLENGKIYTWDLSETMNENEYETYVLSGDTLKFTESFSDDEEAKEASRYFMPMTFTRKK